MEKRERILKEYIPAVLYGRFSNGWSGGTRHFEGVPLEKLQELHTKGLLSLEERQNDSPTIGEFMEMMPKFPKLTAHGYIVSEKRADARTSIEGLSGFVSYSEMPEASRLLAHADEWNAEETEGGYTVRAWWD